MLCDGPRYAYPGLCRNGGDRRARASRKNLWLCGKGEHPEIPSADLPTVIPCLVLQVHARVTSPREAPPMEANANWTHQSKEVAYNILGALDAVGPPPCSLLRLHSPSRIHCLPSSILFYLQTPVLWSRYAWWSLGSHTALLTLRGTGLEV